MASKFAVYLSLTHAQRSMLDKIHANGRGPSDQAVLKMLLGALEDFWRRHGVLPSPMRIVPEMQAERLHALADELAELEAETAEPGVMAVVTPGYPAPTCDRDLRVAEAGPSVDELAAGEAVRRALRRPKTGGAPKVGASGKRRDQT